MEIMLPPAKCNMWNLLACLFRFVLFFSLPFFLCQFTHAFCCALLLYLFFFCVFFCVTLSRSLSVFDSVGKLWHFAGFGFSFGCFIYAWNAFKFSQNLQRFRICCMCVLCCLFFLVLVLFLSVCVSGPLQCAEITNFFRLCYVSLCVWTYKFKYIVATCHWLKRRPHKLTKLINFAELN